MLDYEIESLKRTVNSLNTAIELCYKVTNAEDRGENIERSFPFATGYSRSAMESAVEDINRVITTINTLEEN